MQPKISDFFNLRVPPPKTPIQQPQILHQIFDRKTQDPRYPCVQIWNKSCAIQNNCRSPNGRQYQVCSPRSAISSILEYRSQKPQCSSLKFSIKPSIGKPKTLTILQCNGDASQHTKEKSKECSPIPSRILEKKRSYAQLHLDLGQSDFLLHTCSICGFMYACGYEGDEKVQKEFHKDCTHGIPFKGWNNERVVNLPSNTDGRIILVLDGDPTAHKKKVQKVIEMMEIDLGSGWLIHKSFKVYLVILQKRIAGCLVAEPVKTAYRVLSNSEAPESIKGSNANKNGSNSSKLQFGGIIFQREAMKRAPSAINPAALEEELMGALILGDEAVPAICGIRGIWVAPAMRRKQIASQLLDTVRVSFCEGFVLKSYRLEFSDPTSSGMALACSYFNTPSFLAYKID